MKNFEELKAEAVKRGIVPGAVIECVADGITGTVADFSEWTIFEGLFVVGKDRSGRILCAFAASSNSWAKVITPAPTQQHDTLQPGDACECSEAMQMAIIEMAAFMDGESSFESGWDFVLFANQSMDQCNDGIVDIKTKLTASEFIRRLENMAPMKMLGDHVYTIEEGHVIADGNRIPFEHIHKLNAEILELK